MNLRNLKIGQTTVFASEQDKAKGPHKYIERTGTPGAYKYEYEDAHEADEDSSQPSITKEEALKIRQRDAAAAKFLKEQKALPKPSKKPIYMGK